jgi:signal peptidase
MKKDKIKSYILESMICIILFFALFVPNIFTRIVLAIILTIYMIMTRKNLQKRNILSMYHNQATVLMILLGAVYLMIFYLLGLYFGYYEATIKFSVWSIFNFTIPTALIIISSEIIRSIFLAEKSNISKILTTISMILIDVIIYSNIYQITTFDGFVNIMSFTIFASISGNLLYNYISVRFGSKSVIVFRLITVLYAYIIPIIPDVYIFFRCFLRIVYPYVLYLILEKCYSKDNFVVAAKDKRKNIIITVILGVIMILIIMLISCKFKYGMLVIASGSMTGTINRGDAIIFEDYEGQTISTGEVIIFEKDNMNVVHRVIDMKLVNGEYRYYTKGDANQHADEGYITNNEIVGISKFRVIHIGYPTIWLRDIFKKT